MPNNPMLKISDITDFGISLAEGYTDAQGRACYRIIADGDALHEYPYAFLVQLPPSPEGCEFYLTVDTPDFANLVNTPFSADALIALTEVSQAMKPEIWISARPVAPPDTVIRKRAVIILNKRGHRDYVTVRGEQQA